MSLLSKALLVLALVFALLGSAEASCQCQLAPAPVGQCLLTLNVCGCIHHLKLTYKAIAMEPTTGLWGYSEGHKSGTGAAEWAITNMFMLHPQLRDLCHPNGFVPEEAVDLQYEKLNWTPLY